MFRAIKDITEKFAKDLCSIPVIACEVEFYTSPIINHKSEQDKIFLASLYKNLADAQINISSLDREVTNGQYELSLCPRLPIEAVKEFLQAKQIIEQTLMEFSHEAVFRAKPFADKIGSGLHIHIGLYDAITNKNLLARKDEHNESEMMLYAIAGLCENMLKDFVIFAPYEEAYARYSSARNIVGEGDEQVSAYNHSPVNVSWGGNNRTTAIRIPTSTIDEQLRHIEHRVACADANAAEVVRVILEACYHGISNKITPPEKIYGNAYDAKYNFLQSFPRNLNDAKGFLSL